ncbi:MAG: DUF1501 domain-containing protein [Planctomycetales bacterium]|nr:DUF1501 domain-containing protein [Planctomycetales bacterium]
MNRELTDIPVATETWLQSNRRRFLVNAGCSIGLAALATLFVRNQWNSTRRVVRRNPAVDDHPPLGKLVASRSRRSYSPGGAANRIIYLHQGGAPSQLDLFDYKGQLAKWHGSELPDSVRQGQRLTDLTANQASLPLTASKFRFKQYGSAGAWLSEILPCHQEIVDDVCFVRSMYTEAINHVQAASLTHTGSQQPGRPSLGAWLSYGLGSLNDNLPTYVVLTSKGSAFRGGESLQQRLWSNGFLSAKHQGVKFRSNQDPVLYLSNPAGLSREQRRQQLDCLSLLNQDAYQRYGDPAITDRIEQFEMAFRMQDSVPAIADLSDEPESTFQLYGQDARRPGTFAANCVMARRLAERDVRFIQLFHRGWDQHSAINDDLPKQARDVDQASAALVLDLKQRGLLDDTLVIWGSEFGRTVYCQGALSDASYGRDHHPRCFSVWLAGGGIRPGIVYGETDEFGYNVAENPVHVHDLNATILHCMGIDHQQLTFRHMGRDFRLTDVGGQIVHDILV